MLKLTRKNRWLDINLNAKYLHDFLTQQVKIALVPESSDHRRACHVSSIMKQYLGSYACWIRWSQMLQLQVRTFALP